MATIAELQVQIGADISRLEKGISRAQRKLQDAGRSMQRVGRSMTMAISAPMAAVGALAVKTAADYETLRVSMDALNGSAEEGARNFERLKDFSAETPFQLKDLAKTQNMLQGFGLEADHAFESLSMIGDIAAITGANIRDIGRVFGKSAAEGRLMTEEILQLVDNSVPAFKLLAETMNVPQSQIRSLAEEGKISFDILQEAFRNATSEGGVFEDGMRELSQTTNGLFSTLRDAVSNALADIGYSITKVFNVKDLIRSLTESIQSGIDAFNSLSQETQKMAFMIAGLLGASGPILVAVGTLMTVLSAISWPIVLGVAAIGGAIAAIVANWDTLVAYFTTGAGAEMWDTIRGSAISLFDSLKGLFNSARLALEKIWAVFGGQILRTTKTAWRLVKGALQTAFDGLALALDVFTGRWITDWDGFWDDNLERVRTFAGNVAEVFLGIGRDMPNLFGKLVIGKNGNRWVRNTGEEAEKTSTKLWMMKNPVEEFGGTAVTQFGRAESAQRRLMTTTQKLVLDFQELRRMMNKDWTFGVSMQPEEDTGNGEEQPLVRAEKPIQKVTQSAKDLSVTFSAVQRDFSRDASEFAIDAEKGMSLVEAAMGKAKKTSLEFGQALQTAVSNAVTSFAQTIGNVFTGDAGASSFFNSILLIAADFASQLGKIMIAIGTASLALQSAFANPLAAIAAGAALVALSQVAKNLIKKGPQGPPELAQGGLAFGPTLAVVGDNKNARSNPEVIAPLDKLKGMMGQGGGNVTRVEGIIRGSDIHLANERGKNKFR